MNDLVWEHVLHVSVRAVIDPLPWRAFLRSDVGLSEAVGREETFNDAKNIN